MLKHALICCFMLLSCAEQGPHFLWSQDAQKLENPFPDARLVDGKGVITLRENWYTPFLPPKAVTPATRTFFNRYANDLKRDVVGFGNVHLTLLPMSDAVDASSLEDHIFRLASRNGKLEVLESNVAFETRAVAFEFTKFAPNEGEQEFIVVRPEIPMPENANGFLVITRGVKTEKGKPFIRDESFANHGVDSTALSEIARTLKVKTENVIFAIPQNGVALAETFESLQRWVQANPAQWSVPKKEIRGNDIVGTWKATDSDFSLLQQVIEKHAFGRPATHVAQVVVAELNTRDLRDEGVFKKEWVENPSLAPQVALRTVVTLPSMAKPTNGYKAILATHGIGSRNSPNTNDSNGFCLEMAEVLAKEGYACIGIDATSHGTRGSYLSFFDVVRLAKMRDNFRQMTFDLLQLSNAISKLDIDGDGVGDFQPDISLLGQSLGGIMGATVYPFSENLKQTVLNVPGGGLANLVRTDDLRARLGVLIAVVNGLNIGSQEYYASFPLFRAVAQLTLNSADPLNLMPAAQTRAKRGLLIQEAIGDLTIPNLATENLAHVAGAALISKKTNSTDPIVAHTQFDVTKYFSKEQAAAVNPHDILFQLVDTRSQAMTFIRSQAQEIDSLSL